MFNCRTFDHPNGPYLHVHDEPGYAVDALRCAQNGWDVAFDRCRDPETTPSDGDQRFEVYTTIDLVARTT